MQPIPEKVTTAVPPPADPTEYGLIGRVQEWQSLRATWHKVRQRGIHFVCIVGEAGIDKSRLAAELLTTVQHQGYATARTRCYALDAEADLVYIYAMYLFLYLD